MEEALAAARDDGRASIVEAVTYRLGDHTTADDASRYRPKDELDAARRLEPLVRMKSYLAREHDWSDADDDALRADCAAEIKRAIEAYQAFPDQEPGEFFDYMFAQRTADLDAQKQEWLTERKRHG